MKQRKYDVAVCPKCGDHLSVWEVEPISITDVGAERDDQGEFICPECECRYEMVEAVDARDIRG